MLSEEIPFSEWRPDLGSYKTGLTEAKNCLSYGGVYKPVFQLQSSTDALPAKAVGAFSVRGSDGVTHVFAGTRTKLYKLNGTAWDDVTRTSGGDYTTATDGYWIFCNFGDLVIATNYNDDIQVFDLGTSTNFARLSTTAPKAKYVFIINNFLVCLDTVDSDGVIPTRVRWSALGDVTDFTPSIDTQAGFNNLFGGGAVNIAGTGTQTFGTIIQDSCIWRMEYNGGDTIFNFNLEVQSRGSKLAKSVKTNGSVTYFADEDGFYAFDGRTALPIGRNKIDKWFFDRFNSSFDYTLSAAIDPINRTYSIAFPTVQNGSEDPQLILTFNEVDQRWTYIEQPVDLIFEALTFGYTLEQLGAEYPNIETVPYSFDSRFWQGGRFLYGAITSDFKFGAFNGQPYTAVITTEETRVNQAGKANIYGIQPIIEDGTVTARLMTRDKITDSVVYTASKGKNSITDEIDLYANSRYIAAEFTISGTWDNAKGFAYYSRPAGRV